MAAGSIGGPVGDMLALVFLLVVLLTEYKVLPLMFVGVMVRLELRIELLGADIEFDRRVAASLPS
jgi:hypothetical protein